MKKSLILAPMVLLAGCGTKVADVALETCVDGRLLVITGSIYADNLSGGSDIRTYTFSDGARILNRGMCEENSGQTIQNPPQSDDTKPDFVIRDGDLVSGTPDASATPKAQPSDDAKTTKPDAPQKANAKPADAETVKPS